jgi:hypothetical protein
LTAAACSYLLPAEIRLGFNVNASPQQRLPRALAALAVLAVAFTFLAAQVDFVRRNRIGITPERYWRPQLLQIWLPGLGLALVTAGACLRTSQARPARIACRAIDQQSSNNLRTIFQRFPNDLHT